MKKYHAICGVINAKKEISFNFFIKICKKRLAKLCSIVV